MPNRRRYATREALRAAIRERLKQRYYSEKAAAVAFRDQQKERARRKENRSQSIAQTELSKRDRLRNEISQIRWRA